MRQKLIENTKSKHVHYATPHLRKYYGEAYKLKQTNKINSTDSNLKSYENSELPIRENTKMNVFCNVYTIVILYNFDNFTVGVLIDFKCINFKCINYIVF